MKNITSLIGFVIIFSRLTPAFAQSTPVLCANSVSVSSVSIQDCHKSTNKATILSCLEKAFSGNSEIVLQKDGRLFRARYLQQQNRRCITFDGWTFQAPVSLGYRTEDGVPFAEGSSIKISAGGIEFNGYFCGWDSDGKFRRTLAPHFKFIPPGTDITVSYPKCVPARVLDADGIILKSNTQVCGTKLAPQTSFGYAPDDQYHFTALNDGTMKNGDKLIPIKKGKDYRNADPAEHPCAWEETPEEVLNSFTEEHSE